MELGYPSKNTLYRWHKEYLETGKLSDKKDRKGTYTKEQRAAAVKYYLEHGKSVSKTIAALGYPRKPALCDWLNEDLEDSQRKWHCKNRFTGKIFTRTEGDGSKKVL